MSQVLAIKYRPKSFDKLIGQEAVSQTLSLALSENRLSHAYLFSGLRGSGKTSSARIFAKALVCDHGPTPTPCEVCQNCIAANENRHIDIIEMDAASSRKIDDIRDLIEQTKYKPSIAKFKIFIIDEVHMLTREAFNALLKTLEEPPSYVKFILATTDPMKLPPTVLSRTQHFRFKQISKTDILHHLEFILNNENISYEIEALEILSRSGSGSLRDTLTLLDQAIIFSKTNITQSAVSTMLGLLDPKKIEEIFETILQDNKEKIISIVKELETYDCEVIIDELIAYLKDKFFEQDKRFSTLLCDRFFRILSEAKSLLYINADNGFVLTLVFFKMMEALNLKTVDEMIKNLEEEKFRTQNNEKSIKVKKQEEIKYESPKQNNNESLFEQLIARLYDRNYELGECFKNSVNFISLENNILSLGFNPQEECKKTLKNASGIIRHFIQDLFGISTELKFVFQKTENKSNEHQKLDEPSNENQAIQNQNPVMQANSQQNDQQQEINTKKDILKDPFILKATELFQPEKIQIKRKS